jgi:hypothetical protein
MDISDAVAVTVPVARARREANAQHGAAGDATEYGDAVDGRDRSLARDSRQRATRMEGRHGSRSRLATDRDGRRAAAVADPGPESNTGNHHNRPPHDVAMLARWLRLVSIAERAHVALSVLFKIFAVVLSVFVLIRYWDNPGSCRAPLREWVLVNLIAGLVHCAAKSATAVQSRRTQYGTTALSFLFGLAQLFWGLWILVGVILVLVYTSCGKTSPALYITTTIISVLLLFGSQLYHIVILFLMLSPAANTLRMLAAESLGDGHRVASKVEIQNLGSVRWTPDLLDDDADSACAICLTPYDEGAELRMLPCRDASEGESSRGHYFHAECIDTWLTRQAACPICKQDIDPKRRRRQGDSQNSEQLFERPDMARDVCHPSRSGGQNNRGDTVPGRVEQCNESSDNHPTLMTPGLRIVEADQRDSHQSLDLVAPRHSSDLFPAAQIPLAIFNTPSTTSNPTVAEIDVASSSVPCEIASEVIEGAALESGPDIESGAGAAFYESPTSESYPVSKP